MGAAAVCWRARSVVVALLLAWASVASATDGYFQHGYGVRAQGMGGAATAVTGDAFGGANNPALMVWAGNRFDIGATLFSPRRSAARAGNAFGLDGAATSGRDYFVIPGFGYNHMLTSRLALGVTVYANGGMDTDYKGGQIAAGHCGPGAPAANLLCGRGHLGVNLEQLVVAPTVSFKVGARNSLGVSVLLAWQRFEAYGLGAFAGLSSRPGNVTNRGADDSTGVGVRVGWLTRLTPSLSVGASWSPKLHMRRFRKYSGLFAGHGGFDLPENYSVGVAVRPTGRMLVALDYERINYSKVNSVGSPGSRRSPLGAEGGPGFGWHDVNVLKLGVEYRASAVWALRAGYNHTTNPIRASDVTFNILAPGVVKQHVTLGLTRHTRAGGAWTFAYMHAFGNSIAGPVAPLLPGGGRETIHMHEDAFGVAYGRSF